MNRRGPELSKCALSVFSGPGLKRVNSCPQQLAALGGFGAASETADNGPNPISCDWLRSVNRNIQDLHPVLEI